MEITKEVFFRFLKDNNFYEGWMEGYNLDNEIYDDFIPLEEFFADQPAHLWLYSGPSSMAMLCNFPGSTSDPKIKDLEKKYYAWREKYMGLYMDLDEVWMDFVHTNSEKE